MNYFVLPKNNIKIELEWSTIFKPSIISNSVNYYLKLSQLQLNNVEHNSLIDAEYLTHFMNSHFYLINNISANELSVSNGVCDSIIFYELIEIIQLCSINNMPENIACMTTNCTIFNQINGDNKSLVNCLFDYDNVYNTFITNNFSDKIGLFFFEFNEKDYKNVDQYLKNILLVLYVIINFQEDNGTSIIKIDTIYNKVIIDVLYILSTLFDKVIIFKPSISQTISNERYLVCKNRIANENSLYTKMEMNTKIADKMFNAVELTTISIVKQDIPLYFLNKIEDSNTIIAHQQLELFNFILSNKTKQVVTNKLDLLKRHNIIKCVQWCEKFNIPHRKCLNKVNIFLNNLKPIDDDDVDNMFTQDFLD